MVDEAIPSATIKSMLDTHWDTSILTKPTLVDINDSTVGVRVDFEATNAAVIGADAPVFTEAPIGTWVYADQTSRVIVELYTKTSRQSLYNLMREVRRVCHAEMHNETAYQRVQFLSFNELIETSQGVWVGRIIIELLNSAQLMNKTD
jgi:hypothetical protein